VGLRVFTWWNTPEPHLNQAAKPAAMLLEAGGNEIAHDC
jgi:hypothetical protein